MDIHMKLILVLHLLSPVYALILPMSSTNGVLDQNSIVDHVKLLEQTVANIQTQAQSASRSYTAQLAVLHNDLTQAKNDVQSSESEIAKLKTELKATKDELSVVKTTVLSNESARAAADNKLKSTKSEIDSLKRNLTGLISDTESIKAMVGLINLTQKELQNIKTDMQVQLHNSTTLANELTSLRASVSSALKLLAQVQMIPTLANNVSSTSALVLGLQNAQHTNQAALASHTADINQLKTNLSQVLHLCAVNSLSLSGIKSDIAYLQKDAAFEATLSSGSGSTPALNGDALRFDKVAYNVGGGYNASSGVFTAPVSGTYIFWVNVVYGGTDTGIEIYIKSSNAIIGVGHGRQTSTQSVMQGTVDANTVAYLDKGAMVWLTPSAPVHVIEWYSSFGGALLHAL